MKKILFYLSALVCLIAFSYAPEQAEAQDGDYWPQWRGPNADGSAPSANPPTEWSEEKNIRWKATVPGKGSATPIVWGNMVIVQTAVPIGEPMVSAAAPAEPQPQSGRRRRGPAGAGPQRGCVSPGIRFGEECSRGLDTTAPHGSRAPPGRRIAHPNVVARILERFRGGQ